MSVSLLTVWRAARARAVPFTGESAGYLVFLACEELVLAPRGVSLASIALEEDGGVRLSGREAADDGRAERELRGLLARLLEVASSPGLALKRAAARRPSGSLTAFSAELSKALIPFNRAAARRALGRLHRETRRALEMGALAAEPAPSEPAPAPIPSPAPSEAGSNAVVISPPVAREVTGAAAASVIMPVVEEREQSPPPPPAVQIRALPEEVMPVTTTEPFVLPKFTVDFGAGSAPGVDCPTRPETIVARRRRELTPIPEWTEPLPTPLRRLAPVTPSANVEPEETPALPTPRLGYDLAGRETPFLGSLAAEVFDVLPSGEPLAFEIVWDEATERVPAAFEPEPTPEPLNGEGQWPVELADQGAAIPLEPERDALPEAPEPEPYAGMIAEKSDVRTLLGGFQVAHSLGENDLRSELKRLAGIDETPQPTPFRQR